MSGRAPTVVIGLGNPMRRDDGVGPALVEHLESARQTGSVPNCEQSGTDPICDAHQLGLVDLVMTDGEPTRLLEAWRGRERAIVVDTVVAGAEPGTVHRLELGVDPMPSSAPTTSSHEPGIVSAIDLARALDALPGSLVVLGIEPADTDHGRGLSPAVEAAFPELVERVQLETR